MPEPVQVWVVDLDQPARRVHGLASLLDDQETAAVADRRKELHRSRYIVAHGAVRKILGTVLNRDPATIEFDRRCEHCGDAAHGRPRVLGQPDVQYSLSHSQGVGVVAVTSGLARLGVDVEVVAPRRSDLAKLAARVLSAEELDGWRAQPAADQLRAFLGAWTAKEAYLKGLGLGVVRDLRTVPRHPAGWALLPLDLGIAPVTAVATLAVETTAPEMPRIAAWVPPVS